MAVRFILMMSLMMVASADPVPDPDIRVDIKQIVNSRCGGGCCDNDCCRTADGREYRSGYILEAACMKFCCKNGQWELKGDIDPNCGNCTVFGEPWVYTFMHQLYYTSEVGKYVLTQDGLPRIPSLTFGVNGDFTKGEHSDGTPASYVTGVTYYEGATSVMVKCSCPGLPAKDPPFRCSCTVTTPVPPPFWVSWDIMGCIIIHSAITSLTVMVCPIARSAIGNPWPALPSQYYLPYVSIYAPPFLMSSHSNIDSGLNGLCNSYTTIPFKNYTASDGNSSADPHDNDDTFIKSWKTLSCYSCKNCSTIESNTPIVVGPGFDSCYTSNIFGGGVVDRGIGPRPLAPSPNDCSPGTICWCWSDLCNNVNYP